MSTPTDNRDMIIRICDLAKTRDHKIAARQLAQLDTMTETALCALRSYLEARPEREDVPAAVSPAASVEHAAAAATAAAQSRKLGAGPTAYEKAGGAPSGRRPGTRITEEGIYYYDGHVYKVIKSQYSGHWQARRLNPAVKTGRWTYIQGMMGILRAEHRMTAEDSRAYEKLYGYPVCGDCGAPLENDESRRRRIGPVCWEKNGHSEAELEGRD
jgi:Family of unknown function (DUF6011)